MKSLRLNSDAEFNAYVAERPALAARNGKKVQAEAPTLEEQGKKVIRQSGRQPNKTEHRFELEYLIPMRASGEICQYRFESIRLKLANGHWYKCEWTAVNAAGKLVWFEVKGGRPRQFEAGIAQIKVAAGNYPEFEFWLCQYKGKQWNIQKVLP